MDLTEDRTANTAPTETPPLANDDSADGRLKERSEQTHYEVLELGAGASIEEITLAYGKAKELLRPGAIATYGVAEPGEAESLVRQIEDAYTTLSDPARRRAYDEAHGVPRTPLVAAPVAPGPAVAAAPEPAAPSKPEAAAPRSIAFEELSRGGGASLAPSDAEARPVRKAETDLPPDAPVTGDALRRVREARGFTLKDLEVRTKIGKWHLDNIERELYAALPAQVYLRGFLMSLARELKLDPVRVARGYLEQMKAKSAPKPE